MKIAITGATGLVGSALAPFLATQGHEVVGLSRGDARERPGTWARWQPMRREIDLAPLRGTDAVIHLAGGNLAERRWTAARKRELVASRVDTTRWFVDMLSRLDPPPRIFVCASAMGFYGDTGDTQVDEASRSGTGFLADLCRAWETEARRAQSWGARVVVLRTGMVLAPAGGALAKMLPVFRVGLGGRLGSGRQWMSWIALDDVLGAIGRVIEDKELRGPVNLAAPEPVTNAIFTKTLSRVLRRPAVFPVPAPMLRLLFGQLADEALLSSSRLHPGRLLASGYSFRWPDLEAALRHALA